MKTINLGKKAKIAVITAMFSLTGLTLNAKQTTKDYAASLDQNTSDKMISVLLQKSSVQELTFLKSLDSVDRINENQKLEIENILKKGNNIKKVASVFL